MTNSRERSRTHSVEQLYTIIAQGLVRSLPDEWQEARLTFEWIAEDVIEDSASYEDGGVTRYVALDPAGPDYPDLLIELARKMDEAGHPRWQKATFTLDRSGQFTLDFDYPPDGAPRPARLWDNEP